MFHGFVKDTFNDLTGKTAADAANAAGAAQLGFQQQGLDYTMERDKLRNEVGDKALTTYSDIFLDPTGGAQQEQIDLAMNSPLYQQMMQSQGFGEESILRSANATGGLRSGSTNLALGQYGAQLPYQALTDTYGQQLSGLKGLSGFGKANPAIPDIYNNMGATSANTITAAAEAGMQGTNLLMSGVGAYLTGGMPGFGGFGGGGGGGTNYNPVNTPYMPAFGTGNY